MVFMGENVVLAWTILSITDSPLMVGLGLGLRTAPGFFLGMFADADADQPKGGTIRLPLDHRRHAPIEDLGPLGRVG